MNELHTLYDAAIASGADSAYRKRRWGRAAEFAGWLEQDAPESLSADNALRLYRASGGREPIAFSVTAIDELRDSLDFLLYDTIKLEGRFDECASPEGGYMLPGAGKEFVSWLLCLRNPALLGVWNSNAERMLKRIGAYPDTMNRGPIGIRYLDLMEALAWVRARLGIRNFIEVDVLAYLSTRPRGRSRSSAESLSSEMKDALA
ncbi:hypothetical protein GBAR_LOCUS7202 [Geodia barretti]|uniref:Uncharacterized protein n=1 Tax=Geodia barretti TaxID=519541 RepID=A0AA35RI48_GEOBA|nr:hypothetical protein GBAR_LOCUS7202 [Geodia barretti]